MPKNAVGGVFIGGFAFLLGFAVVWHIWWLAIVSLLGIFATITARAFNDDTEYVFPASEVERIETEHHRKLAKARALSGSNMADPVPGGAA